MSSIPIIEKVPLIHQQITECYVNSEKKGRVKKVLLSQITLSELELIATCIERNRVAFIKEASERKDKTIFVRVKTCPGLPRTLQFGSNSAPEAICIHLNRGKCGDFKDQGAAKKVHVMIRVDADIQFFIVTTKVLSTEKQVLNADHEYKIVTYLKEQRGIVSFIEEFRVNYLKEDVKVYSVLEFCRKGNLFDFLHFHTSLPYINKCKLVYDLLIGWNSLYERRIIHRDLKNENFFIKEEGGVLSLVIGDFDSASLEGEPFNEEHVGTVALRAPEIYNSQPFSFASDAWAIGACIHEILGGGLIWERKEIKDTIAVIKSMDKDPFLRPIGDEAEIPLEYIKWRLCKLNPSERLLPPQILEIYGPILQRIIARLI